MTTRLPSPETLLALVRLARRVLDAWPPEVPRRTFGVERSVLRAASRLVDVVPQVPCPRGAAAAALAGDLWWIGHDLRVVSAEATSSTGPETTERPPGGAARPHTCCLTDAHGRP